ncbi:MAG: ATP-binding protein [Bacteroidota bacterium]
MKRNLIKIDEEKCDGCGVCIPNCHEGALQIIDGKARLISDLFCDGLGACIGHCPQHAITIEEREAEPYDEKKVMEKLVKKGRNTILAHIEHLRDHGEMDLVKQAAQYIRENNIDMSVEGDGRPAEEVFAATHHNAEEQVDAHAHNGGGCGGGCPGSASIDFSEIISNGNHQQEEKEETPGAPATQQKPDFRSALKHWPVQMHLINPSAGYYQNADVVIAADCVAYAMGNFHHHFLRGRSLAIACPKLDSNKEIYVEKMTHLIDHSNINTLTVVVMEVPCCSGLLQLVDAAVKKAGRRIPVKQAVISARGELLKEEWML